MSTNPERKVAHRLPIVKDSALPRTRAECIGGPRPCPHRTCRYHLADELPEGYLSSHSCVLDVADRGERSQPEIGAIIGCTKQRVQMIEIVALQKLQRNAGRGAVLALASYADAGSCEIATTVEQAKATDRMKLERARKDRERRAMHARGTRPSPPRDGWWRDIDPEATAAENAERLGVSSTSIYKRAARLGYHLPAGKRGPRDPHNRHQQRSTTPARLDAIRSLRLQGLGRPAIARELGLSRQAIHQLCNRNGID